MITYKEFRKIVGKKIIRVELPRFYDYGREEWLQDPLIVLEDGTKIAFVVQEGSCDYGVGPVVIEAQS